MPLSPQGSFPTKNPSTETTPQPEEAWVLLAHLVRTQGRHGELLADILTDFPERFEERKELVLLPPPALGISPQKVTLESYWLHKGRVVLKFAGTDSITDAEKLRGWDVAVPREQRAPLEDGTYYISDLIGCHVVDIAGGGHVDIGEITDVDRESTSTPLLVIGNARNELLIPFVQAWLQKIDIEGKQIEMTLPNGLLSINAPEKS